MPFLSGRTFFNPVERGDYPSEQLSCLNDDDLIQILLTYIVDIYHQTPHGSLSGETPANCWERLSRLNGILPVPDGLALRVAFGLSFKRRLRGDGVLFAGLSYSSDALREVFLHAPERQVEIRVDLFDLGWIAVRINNDWQAAVCNHAGFNGVRYSDWQQATRNLREKHRNEASLSEDIVSRAVARIKQIDREASLRMQLTPFRVSEAELLRNEQALHFSITPSQGSRSTKELPSEATKIGITIIPMDEPSNPDLVDAQPIDLQTKPWRFDDE